MRVKTKLKYIPLIIILLVSITLTYSNNKFIVNKKTTLTRNVLVDDPFSTEGNNSFDPNDSYDSYNSYDQTYDYSNDYSETALPESDTSTYIDDEINGYRLIIEDDASLLTEEEEKKLYEEMKKTTQYGNVVFKTINANPKYSTSAYAREYYHSKFNLGESGTMFLIDMHYREIYIFSDGSIYNTVTSSKALTITDNTYRYASDRNYFGCAEEAFKEINTLLSGKKIAEPMRAITSFILSLVIAAIIGFLITIKKASLKIAKNKDIVNNLNKKIEIIGNITAEKTGQRKKYNPPSSSSSSGGGHSSGGGGGGHSSGGGGGHRF